MTTAISPLHGKHLVFITIVSCSWTATKIEKVWVGTDFPSTRTALSVGAG